METAIAVNKVSQRKLNAAQKANCMDIMSALGSIKDQLENAQCLFDNTTEPELVDSYIYEILALKKKYCYFLNLCKQHGIAATVPNTAR